MARLQLDFLQGHLQHYFRTNVCPSSWVIILPDAHFAIKHQPPTLLRGLTSLGGYPWLPACECLSQCLGTILLDACSDGEGRLDVEECITHVVLEAKSLVYVAVRVCKQLVFRKSCEFGELHASFWWSNCDEKQLYMVFLQLGENISLKLASELLAEESSH